MLLPFRLYLIDISAICGYLVNKPTGATIAELKAVLDRKFLDERKFNALKYLNFIEDNGSKLRVTDSGRKAVKDSGELFSDVIRGEISNVKPYYAIMERVLHQDIDEITSIEVANHWFEHFKEYASEHDRTLKDQANCFFRLAEGADLGTYIVGRKGKQTRFLFSIDNVRSFFKTTEMNSQNTSNFNDNKFDLDSSAQRIFNEKELAKPQKSEPSTNKVFISYGKNKKILEQLKEIVVFGKFNPVVATEEESAATPVPKKVMVAMRCCSAAVIHVGAESDLYDNEHKRVPQINGNVLMEIGAAMALYDTKFILLVEEGIELPSNLQGLYECRYKGNELDMPATMKFLKAFNEFNL